jgi:hypothetical protein
MKVMKLILFISGLAIANGFIAATRAVKSPGLDMSFLKKKAAAKSSLTKNKPAAKASLAKKKLVVKNSAATDKQEWRWLGRDRDSKTPPLFLTTLYRGPQSIGRYRELTTYEKKDEVKRNPYKNNAPIV